jgi:NAD(P)-dependent dehydrogenase (short-subunit alcohol dehydrogenase family)
MSNFVSNLDTPLLQLTSKDFFTLRMATQGVKVWGGIGAGKTSGAGRALASAYLRAGMGSLILCAKPEEVELWLRYCEQHGRKDSVILFDEKQGCNFIAYEFARKGGTEAASSVTDTMMRILEAADTAAGQKSGKPGEEFWTKTTRQMLLYAIAALYAASGNVTAGDIVRFITTMPTRNPATDEEKAALDKNFAVGVLHKMLTSPAREIPDDLKEQTLSYWRLQYLALPDKTRGSILINVTSSLNRFNTGLLRKCFCDRTTIVPEMSFSGAIIIMAQPVLTYNEDGIVAQQLFKFIWQRAVESRNGLPAQFRERPVFLYADESQYFVNSYDDQFLSTCRGSKACVVYFTQSLPTYYAMLGKEKSDAVDGFCGKFNSHIFHQNADPRTNSFASSLIGRGLHVRRNTSETKGSSTSRGRNSSESVNSNYSYGSGENSGSSGGTSGGWLFPFTTLNHSRSDGTSRNASSGGGSSSTSGYSETDSESHSVSMGGNEHMDTLVEPNFFSQHLKTGGPDNNHEVTALWFKAGGNFNRPMPGATNNVILATFKQERQP